MMEKRNGSLQIWRKLLVLGELARRISHSCLSGFLGVKDSLPFARRSRLDACALTYTSGLARRPARKFRMTRLNAISTMLVGILIFLVGQSAGGTIAYLTSQADVNQNVLTSAKAFAPTDVTAVPIAGGSIVLSWSKATWATQGYQLYRSDDGLSFYQITTTATTGPNTFTYTEVLGHKDINNTASTALTDGTLYYYVVRGVSALNGTGTDSTLVQVTPDATAPTVSSTVPAEAATNIATNTNVTVTFSEPMSQQQSANNFALVSCSSATCGTVTGTIAGTASWTSNSVLTFNPTTDLAVSTWYGIKLTAGSGGVADVAGNTLSNTGCPHLSGSICYRTFQTGASGGATAVLVAAPANGATGVGRKTNIALEFNGTSPTPSGDQTTIVGGFTLKQTSGGGSPCFFYPSTNVAPYTPRCGTNDGGNGTFSWTGTTLTYNPGGGTGTQLVNTQNYTWSVVATTGVNINASGTFTTGGGSDTTAPTISSSTPASAATGVSPNTTLTVVFSEAMNPGVTEGAFSISRVAGGSCTAAAVTGTKSWSSATTMVFTPSAVLQGGCQYSWSVSNAAVDTSGNANTSTTARTFTVGGDVTLTSGTLYYVGGQVTASGAGWSAGSGNVTVTLDGTGSNLGAGVAPSSGSFTNWTFNLPTTATAGSHTLVFTRSGANTVTLPITVRWPSRLTISANPTDISPGSGSTITITAYDNGAPLQSLNVAFSIYNDPDSVGSLTTLTGTTNASGQATTTLNTASSSSRGVVFDDITVRVTSGLTADVVVKDPPPPAPANLRLTSGPSGLTLSWNAPAWKGVKGYRLELGTSSGKYDQDLDVGASTSYVYAGATPGQTYYAVVRAYDAREMKGDPSTQASYMVPLPTATSTPTVLVIKNTATPVPPTATVTPVAPKASPPATAPPATATPTSVPVVATPTLLAISGVGGSPTPTPGSASGAQSGPSAPTVTPTPIAIQLSPTPVPLLAAASPTPASGGAAATATPIVVKGSPTPTVAAGASRTPTAPPTTPPTATRTPTAPPTATATPRPPSPTVLTIAGSGTGAASPTPTPLAGSSGSTSSATATAVPLLGQPPALLSTATLGTVRVAATATPVAAGSPTPIVLKGASPTPIAVGPTPIAIGPSPTGLPAVQLFASASQPTTSSSMPSTTNSLYPSAGQPTPGPTGASGAGGLAGILGLMAAGTPSPTPGTPTATPTRAAAAGSGVSVPGTTTATATPAAGTPTPLAPKASPTPAARH